MSMLIESWEKYQMKEHRIEHVELSYVLLKNHWYQLKLGGLFSARITGVHGDAAEYLVRKFTEYVEDPKSLELFLPQEGIGDISWSVEPISEDNKIVQMCIKADYHSVVEQVTFNVNIKHFLISACMEFKKNIKLMKCDDFRESRGFNCSICEIDILLDTLNKRFD